MLIDFSVTTARAYRMRIDVTDPVFNKFDKKNHYTNSKKRSDGPFTHAYRSSIAKTVLKYDTLSLARWQVGLCLKSFFSVC